MSGKGHWITRERMRTYPRIAFAIFALVGIGLCVSSRHLVDPTGKPLGCDFLTFWAASRMALAGHAADAYNTVLISQVEKLAIPASHSRFAWFYPPTYYLVVLPLGLIPYALSYVLFILATLSGYLLVFWRLFPRKEALWCLAGFSGLWVNFSEGQNAFLTAMLAATGLLFLKRRPALAGVFIGLLAIKPHLALLFPVALVAIRAWRTLFSALLTSAVFAWVSVAILGRPVVDAFSHGLTFARHFTEDGSLPWEKMPTVFALLRMLRVPVPAAYAIHLVVAALATAAVWQVWRRCPDWRIRSATLMTATLLISPYLFDYDLAWLAFPIAWLTLAGLGEGWLPWEREILLAAWVVPVLMLPLGTAVHLQPGPLVLGALLWTAWRRSKLHESLSPAMTWVPATLTRDLAAAGVASEPLTPGLLSPG